MSRSRSAAWVLLTVVSVWMAEASFRYVTGNPAAFDGLFRAKYIAHLGVVWSHGVSATLALAIGPWQFWSAFRPRWRGLHRVMGVLYMACMLVGGTSAVLMGLDAHGGVPSKIGFVVMGIGWMVTAALAWRSVRRKDILAHRQWMTRNFALTFGAVMLRLYLYGLQQVGFAFNDVYPFVTWGAWVPNLVLAECWIRSTIPTRTRALRPAYPATGPSYAPGALQPGAGVGSAGSVPGPAPLAG